VHVWRRGDKYSARGRYQGQAFGETLGGDVASATSRLRQLLVEIGDGSFVRPSEANKRARSVTKVPRLTLRQLLDEFLSEKRKVRGEKTAVTYKSRLMPVLDCAETAAHRKRWPLALDIDREFAVALRTFLYSHETTRNGRVGGRPKTLSASQVLNILECLRVALVDAVCH
jgi:hypothetical protein